VAEQGGYSAAARSLGLSQPTVSFHVQALERAFGATLLVYRERRVRLTAAGEAAYALARRTLRDVAELSAQIAGLHAGHAGRVRLAASIAFEQEFFFGRVVAPFTRAGLGHYRVALEISGIQARVLAARAGLGMLAVFWPPYARRIALPGLRPVPLAGERPAGPGFGLAALADEPALPSVTTLGGWLRQVAALPTRDMA
jgi:DNA-binding transcriptional LysR family regulator